MLDGEQVKRIVAGLPFDEPPASPEPPRVPEDRSRKEVRPGFVPHLNHPLPQE